MHSWLLAESIAANTAEVDISKLPEQLETLLNDELEGVTRAERMDEMESDSFGDFEAAMRGFSA